MGNRSFIRSHPSPCFTRLDLLLLGFRNASKHGIGLQEEDGKLTSWRLGPDLAADVRRWETERAENVASERGSAPVSFRVPKLRSLYPSQ